MPILLLETSTSQFYRLYFHQSNLKCVSFSGTFLLKRRANPSQIINSNKTLLFQYHYFLLNLSRKAKAMAPIAAIPAETATTIQNALSEL